MNQAKMPARTAAFPRNTAAEAQRGHPPRLVDEYALGEFFLAGP